MMEPENETVLDRLRLLAVEVYDESIEELVEVLAQIMVTPPVESPTIQ